MKLAATALLASLVLTVGCASKTGEIAQSSHPQSHAEEPTEVDQSSDETAIAESAPAAPEAAKSTKTASNDPRRVGDYVTYSFSGSYRKDALVLTQRVVAKGDSDITIDYTFKDKAGTETLRVVSRTDAGQRGEVLSVARVAADGTSAEVDKSVFEARSLETAAAADVNEAQLDETQTSVKLGDTTVQATKATYRVRVGKKKATLETTASTEFAWGDLGGSIVASDGTVFYRAEVVDVGTTAAATASLE
ncbi:MAG: hypothetical protein U0271_06135 [Polyangiaceae bacterium]